jgi:dephospho-CoA kinase
VAPSAAYTAIVTPDRTTHRSRPLRIGITGPIGCGKSTVASWLGERPGVVVIDADQVAREVLDRGEPAVDAVVQRFGIGLLLDDGTLDRAALGRIVFADPAALRDLEAIVHPAVRPRILAAIAAADADGAASVVIEAIKLVESGLAEVCDEVWLVTCDAAAQRVRLVGRGMPAADTDQRVLAQAGLGERVAPAATLVIDTSGEPAETRAVVERALDAMLGATRGGSPG